MQAAPRNAAPAASSDSTAIRPPCRALPVGSRRWSVEELHLSDCAERGSRLGRRGARAAM